jgi:glycerol dehydrogenase
MLRVFGAPHRYVQGPDALAQLGELIGVYGSKPLVVVDEFVARLLRQDVMSGLGPLAEAAQFIVFQGECTSDEISRIAGLAHGCDVVVGVGGGKTIDTAKGVSILLGARVAIVPTVASNDSPTSRLAVLYTDQHVLSEVRLMATNPDLVLVDTAIIARAPRRFFVAGIGDALSKKFEAAQCFAVQGPNFYKAQAPYLAQVLGDACYATIRAHAQNALLALDQQTPDEAFERVVEATILLSGLAFESGGLSMAHSILRGFSAIESLNRALHGEQVAFGLLVQLVLEGRSEADIEELLDFYVRIGLPRNLAMLGHEGAAADIAPEIARHTWATAPYVRHLEAPVDADRIQAALLLADRMGSRPRP